ncbi:tetratricopeptide repeat protein [Streptosporangium carneum]|uniref:Uncharacterized protein n=1 Tax=Streptosporangium carneum TaxID=47481 RepID=A0A9W6I804_9ACTN|nr:tetratricopeptide repeat protein [Streptosporangium carneum]GLK12908.1 hypothetical protein GCM10017600_63180 [Streptosporangium carneum]
MALADDTTAKYSEALRELHEAAGSPTGETIKRQAERRRPPLKISNQSWSDWRRGLNVPSDEAEARFLIACLKGLARRRSPEYEPPPDAWWEQTRKRALEERRAGTGRGGRPPARHPAPRGRRPVPLMPEGGPPPGDLAGREADVAELDLWLDGADTSVAVLTGLAGVGKTALATHVLHRALDTGRFGGCLFVDMQGYDPRRRKDADQVLASFLQTLGVAAGDVPAEPSAREALYRSILADCERGGRSLIVVLDNACSARDVAPLLPGSPAHKVLITSRHTLADVGGARIVELRELSAAESLAMLAGRLRAAGNRAPLTGADTEQLAETARLCGRLPLALHIAAALLICEPNMPVASLVRELSATAERLDTLEYEDLAVRAAFELSYRHLTPAQARLFRLLALNPGDTVGAEAAAALVGLNGHRAHRLLRCLRTAHLIEDGSAEGRYRFHDLMREFAGELLSAEEPASERDAATDRLLEYYEKAVSAARRAWFGLGERPSATAVRKALSWLDAERSNLFAAVALAHATGRWRRTCSLAEYLTHYAEFRHLVDDLLTAQTLALNASARVGRIQECTAAADLGIACRLAHRYDDALAHLRRALAIAENLPGTARWGNIQHDLGLTYFQMGRHADAEACHRADLAVCLSRGDVRGQAHSLTALGDAQRMRGRHLEAVVSLSEAIALAERLDAPNILLIAHGNLALTYLAWPTGPPPDYAIRHLCSMLETATAIDARRFKALAFLNLGAAYADRCPPCSHDAAVHWGQEAAKLFTELGDLRYAARALKNVGVVHARAGDPDTADACFQRALAAFTDVEMSQEIEKTRLLMWDVPPLEAPCEHSPQEAWMTEWLNELPHAILRGDTSHLRQVMFLKPVPRDGQMTLVPLVPRDEA